MTTWWGGFYDHFYDYHDKPGDEEMMKTVIVKIMLMTRRMIMRMSNSSLVFQHISNNVLNIEFTQIV